MTTTERVIQQRLDALRDDLDSRQIQVTLKVDSFGLVTIEAVDYPSRLIAAHEVRRLGLEVAA